MTSTFQPSLHIDQRTIVATGTGITVSPRSISTSLDFKLPASKLTLMCQSLEGILNDSKSRVVYVTSPYGKEGAGTVAFEAAIVAATQMGRRALFLDLSSSHDKKRKTLVQACDAIGDNTGLEMRVVTVEGTRFSYACVYDNLDHQTENFNVRFLKEFIDESRKTWDVIFIFSGQAINDNVAVICAKLSDGVVLVVEAERTRVPVARQAKELLEMNGGRVIGAVLTRRRFYIPGIIYALFFKTFGRRG